ncbi:MAG: hypothetical protein ACKVTZ_16825 [Bacteroidia bacterium]
MQWFSIFIVLLAVMIYRSVEKAREKAILIGIFFGIIFLTQCLYPLLLSWFAFSLLEWTVINLMLFFSVILTVTAHAKEIRLEKEAREQQSLRKKIEELGNGE